VRSRAASSRGAGAPANNSVGIAPADNSVVRQCRHGVAATWRSQTAKRRGGASRPPKIAHNVFTRIKTRRIFISIAAHEWASYRRRRLLQHARVASGQHHAAAYHRQQHHNQALRRAQHEYRTFARTLVIITGMACVARTKIRSKQSMVTIISPSSRSAAARACAIASPLLYSAPH